MAKGDSVAVTYEVGGAWHKEEVKATKAGRTVKVERTARQTKVIEMTRTGRPAGHTLTIMNIVLAVLDERFTVQESASHAPKRKPRATPAAVL